MLSDLLSKIEAQYLANLPFVVYRKPKESMVTAIFQKDDKLNHLKDFNEAGFVFVPFNASETAVLLKPDQCHRCQIKIEVPVFSKKRTLLPQKEQEVLYTGLINKAIASIREGHMSKVVLSRKLKVPSNKDPLVLLQDLLASYPDAFCYLWHHPKVGTWLGATPEMLLHIQNKRLSTMSLAGTVPFREKEEPTWGQKELEEQKLVTQYITEVLKDKVTDLTVAPLESVRAGGVWHLRNLIYGTVKEDVLGPIIKVLHPTPAVCGFPKPQALNFIAQNENYDREYYAGFLGELNLVLEQGRPQRRKNQENKAFRTLKKTTALFVNLRCLQLNNNEASVYVGGGITQDSDPKKEWKETVAKSATMLKVLLNFDKK
ncbi:chorismate-binding protein [Spongiimicrobium sp. 3-5]|uniref:chorismate-binding protein n=1 Tax=Spongiimicrobium sp. 3-5 TaxID=3332596 RepID=UPI00397EB57A